MHWSEVRNTLGLGDGGALRASGPDILWKNMIVCLSRKFLHFVERHRSYRFIESDEFWIESQVLEWPSVETVPVLAHRSISIMAARGNIFITCSCFTHTVVQRKIRLPQARLTRTLPTTDRHSKNPDRQGSH